MLDSTVVREFTKIHNLPAPRTAGNSESDETFIGYPRLPEKALPGELGGIIGAIEPYTEADKAGLLMHFLAAFGCAIGRTAHFRIGQAYHYLKLNVVIVGASGFGRKGTSWDEIKPIIERADGNFERRIIGGLSSGEGLIHAVRDPLYKEVKKKNLFGEEFKETEIIDAGIEDKRAFIIETEFASVLQRAKREGNTLSAIVRQAWDAGTLRVMTKQVIEATNSHISIVGHITRDELQKHLTDSETGNGFANRFLWACVRRSKYLPNGDAVPETYLNEIVRFTNLAIGFGQNVGELRRDSLANEKWWEVYPQLSDGHTGLLGAVTSRGAAYVLRLACLYAILDFKETVEFEHLESALALWSFCEDSARYIFGVSVGDAVADKIELALKEVKEGLTQTQISKLFQRHEPAERIKNALSVLIDNGRAESVKQETVGRPRIIFRYTGNV